jgi:gamma-glutamyl phosphate reductase
MKCITELSQKASGASRILVNLTEEKKNEVLLVMASGLRADVTTILVWLERWNLYTKMAVITQK